MHVIVIGAGYGGLTCALRLARKARGRARVTLINGSDRFVQRIRLHQHATGQRPAEPELRSLVRGTGVTLTVGWVERIDLQRKTVEVGGESLPWDRLVLALGSTTDVSLEGAREHAYTLDPGRASELAERLATLAETRGRVLVVGGGLSGIEAATELAETHPSLRVSLVTRRGIADGWSERARVHTRAVLGRLGVELREGVETRAIEQTRLRTSAGVIDFDLCVWTAGFGFPRLPRDAGLAVDEHGRVRVDPCLRSTSHEDVYAVGDIANPVVAPGQPLPMGCKSALPTGAYVADSLAGLLRGREPKPFDLATAGYCVSLGRRDGLIQFVGDDGEPTGSVVTGRAAAVIKELICKGTVWALQLERLGLSIVAWTKTGHPPALVAAKTS